MTNTTPTTTPSDLVVFVDLDNTMICTKVGGDADIEGWRENALISDVIFGDNPRRSLPHTAYKRPFLEFFLKELSSRYAQVHVFTAANRAYADPILDKLDPHGRIFTKRWYNDSCKHVNGSEYDLRKNVFALDCSPPLTIDPKRFVLIDDRQDYMMDHLSNGILVSEFIVSRDDASDGGKNVAKQDSSLLSVLELLKQLDEAEDVRPLLDQKFKWSLIQRMADMNMELGATAL
jgi:TFIIF-interacting CTD phosphatase-like protein